MRRICLPEYDWEILLYDDVSPNNYREVARALEDMGVGDSDIREISGLFDYPNRGFIYSDKARGFSLIAIGWCTSWKQEVNTLAHEIFHLAEHVCKGNGLSTDGEPPAYVVSELVDRICN